MKYTVVLNRSSYISDGEDAHPSQDIYVAHVEAEDSVTAVSVAKIQALAADKQDQPNSDATTDDYIFIVMFKGTQAVELFGWQL